MGLEVSPEAVLKQELNDSYNRFIIHLYTFPHLTLLPYLIPAHLFDKLFCASLSVCLSVCHLFHQFDWQGDERDSRCAIYFLYNFRNNIHYRSSSEISKHRICPTGSEFVFPSKHFTIYFYKFVFVGVSCLMCFALFFLVNDD